MKTSRPKALVFDAYGTLFDLGSIAIRCEKTFPGKGSLLAQLWRQNQLKRTWLLSLMKRYENFQLVTYNSLRTTLKEMKLAFTDETIEDLSKAYIELRPFPEVVEALTDAKKVSRLSILSNGTPDMLSKIISDSGLDPFFDPVLSVDAVGTYKPDPRVYELSIAKLSLPKAEILFVSSNAWDIAGAKSFGFRTGFVNRNYSLSPSDEFGVASDFETVDLSRLVKDAFVSD